MTVPTSPASQVSIVDEDYAAMLNTAGPDCVGFRLFLRLLWHSLFHAKGTAGRLSLKRGAMLLIGIPAFLILLVIHRVAMLLDNVFFPGFRNLEVKEPVFMVGIPRSGTTFLHHVLSRDKENFTSFTLGEMLFAPAIIERKFWSLVGRVDNLFGQPGRRLVKRVEGKLLAEMRKIHYVSVFEADEDEQVLIWFFSSALLLIAFPFPEKLWGLMRFDTALKPELKKKVMQQYLGCVKRHLYFHGTDKHFLSKNPLFSPKVTALRDTFPDARIICNVRSPYAAVPSLMSLMSFYWDTFDNAKQGAFFRDMCVEAVQHFYRHPIAALQEWEHDRYAFVKYDELAKNPLGIVTDLYDRFGFQKSDEFDLYLHKEQAQAKDYKSKHHYTFDEHSLTVRQVLEEFYDIFDHFSFEMETAPAQVERKVAV